MSNQDQHIPDWHVVLQKIIQQPKERQQIAALLGINPVTLTRWAKENARPQQAALARLIKVVPPQYKEELFKALAAAFPNLEEKWVEETSEIVPSSFFRQILRERATVTEMQLPWQLATTMLNKAISMLDPHNLGMAITPVLCMPPVDGRILSLRERDGRGTPPWHADMDHQSSFLGLGSLAAYVVQTGHAASVADVAKERYIPIFAYPPDREKSAAACPIWLEGKIAGCLLAVSLQVEHFTQTRIDLLLDFTNMFSLALNEDDFYDHKMIHLRYIPKPEQQQPLLLSFRQRVNNLMKRSMQEGHPYSTQEAEKVAWRQIEQELILMGERDDPPNIG